MVTVADDELTVGTKHIKKKHFKYNYGIQCLGIFMCPVGECHFHFNSPTLISSQLWRVGDLQQACRTIKLNKIMNIITLSGKKETELKNQNWCVKN